MIDLEKFYAAYPASRTNHQFNLDRIADKTFEYLYDLQSYKDEGDRRSVAQSWFEVALYLQHCDALGALLSILLDQGYECLTLKQRLALYQLEVDHDR